MEQGEAQATRRYRGWSMITLDRPTWVEGRGRDSFYHAVIRPLIAIPGGRSDNIYAWLEIMFEFCAGKPFVYYSRYRPSPRIFDLARTHRIALTWCPLASLSPQSVKRHRTWRQLWLSKSQWKRLHARLAAAQAGAVLEQSITRRR